MSAVFRSLVVCEREGSNALGPFSKSEFDESYFANEGFTLETAEGALAADDANSVAFGKRFLANPDLPKRSHRRAHLPSPRPSTLSDCKAISIIRYSSALEAGIIIWGERPPLAGACFIHTHRLRLDGGITQVAFLGVAVARQRRPSESILRPQPLI